eukprot:641129-Pyramimonas_sp.AAC.1
MSVRTPRAADWRIKRARLTPEDWASPSVAIASAKAGRAMLLHTELCGTNWCELCGEGCAVHRRTGTGPPGLQTGFSFGNDGAATARNGAADPADGPSSLEGK